MLSLPVVLLRSAFTVGRVGVAGGVAKSASAPLAVLCAGRVDGERLDPLAVLPLPVVLSRAPENRCRVEAGGVVKERLITDGGVVVAGGVVKQRRTPLAVLWAPVVLLKSASVTSWPCCQRRWCC